MKDSLNNVNQQANVNNPLKDEVKRQDETKIDPEIAQAQLITATISRNQSLSWFSIVTSFRRKRRKSAQCFPKSL